MKEDTKTACLFDTLQLLKAYEHAIDENIISTITDTKGVIVHVNKKFCEISKYTADEVIGKHHRILNSGYHSKEFFKKMWQTIGKGNVWHNEIRNKAKDGTIYWVDTVIVPIKDENEKNTHYLSLRTLITERKQLQETLQIANEVLEQKVLERTMELIIKNEKLETQNQELQQFNWVTSHDLQEPLRKIKTYSFLIKESLKGEKAEIIAFVDIAIKSAEQMSNKINDLLHYSHLSMNSTFKLTSLNDCIQDVIAVLEEKIKQKEAIVNVSPMPSIDAIKGHINQVFQNLIDNALKFSKPDEPPIINITAELISEKKIDGKKDLNGTYCRIVISDNGIGFDEIYLGKIFAIFQRLHAGETYEGTGIGLAIAKKIIDKHNGLIQAKSKLNEGSIFTIILPLLQNSSTSPIMYFREHMQSKQFE
jgi:PAS domain S-box-containing protein